MSSKKSSHFATLCNQNKTPRALDPQGSIGFVLSAGRSAGVPWRGGPRTERAEVIGALVQRIGRQGLDVTVEEHEVPLSDLGPLEPLGAAGVGVADAVQELLARVAAAGKVVAAP